MTRVDNYYKILELSYDEAVRFLLKKYGAAEDDYYREKSYEKFLNGEIKNITKGKYSRSSEGLECHHIDEDKFLNLTNKDFIKDQSPPFKYHKKEKLVFCNVVEHAILHTLIAKETSLNFGYAGYIVFLRQKIQDWYIDKDIPKKSKYHIACYHKAYLKPKEASELLEKMDNILSAERKRIEQKKQEKIKKVIREGNFKSLNNDSSRSEIVRAIYDLNKIGASGYIHLFKDLVYSEKHGKYVVQSVEFEEFKQRMEPYDLNGIIKNIQLFINYTEGELSHREYFSQREQFSKTKKEIEDERRVQQEKERLEKLKREEFYSLYPDFEKKDINYNIMRQDVNALLFKHSDKYSSFIKFQSAMKKHSMSELLEELHSVMKEK